MGARLAKKSSTPGLSSRSAAQAQLVSSGSVGPCGLALATLVGYQPLLLEERFPITCSPPLVQAPAFYRSYLSVVEVWEDPEVRDEATHLVCCCPEPVVVLRSLVVVQVSQIDRARSSCFLSLYLRCSPKTGQLNKV